MSCMGGREGAREEGREGRKNAGKEEGMKRGREGVDECSVRGRKSEREGCRDERREGV